MVLRVGIKKAPDHPLILRVVFSRLVFKEIHASLRKRDRHFDPLVPEN
jgi:hypothetical protein